ncbi:MAG: FAD-dependent oxidoreductase, partial [Pseudonocardia sp.]
MRSRAHSDVLIVGASVAGLTAADALRSEGFPGRITMIGDEDVLPYGRPALSKQILVGEWSADESTLCSPAELDGLGVQFLRGTAARSLDRARRVVTTSSGEELQFGTLVAATGVAARRPAFSSDLAGVHCLR